MRHRNKVRHLNRTAEHKRALMRNMTTSLVKNERVRTTLAKARELKRYAEPLVTKARRGDDHARRMVAREIHDKDALWKLFEEIGPRFAERPGGYTRVLKLGSRQGDAAEMAIIEFVE